MGYFVPISGNDSEFYAVRLASVQLVAKSGGMGIWSVAPGRMESSLDVDLSLLEFLNHMQMWMRKERMVWFLKEM